MVQTTDFPRPGAGRLLATYFAWAFRNADWLTADRARAWSRILAVLLLIRVALWLILPQPGQ